MPIVMETYSVMANSHSVSLSRTKKLWRWKRQTNQERRNCL